MEMTNDSSGWMRLWLKIRAVATKEVSFSWVKPLVFVVILLFAIFLVGEFAASYFLFRRAYFGYSALWQVGSEFKEVISKRISQTGTPSVSLIRVVNEESNPFMTTYADRRITDDIFRIHPFIDFTNVSTRLRVKPRVDYFGFRNAHDLYFDSVPEGVELIVLTGGSEASGHLHQITISERLEKLLNEQRHKGPHYRVLNLAMNGYAISHEINAFVNLAFHLKPKFVISHSGWNDVINGSMVPPKFKKLGLNYIKFEEYWLPRLYDLKDGPSFLEWTANDQNADWITESFFKNVGKYESIVSANGGKLIFGAQPYNRNLDGKDKRLFHMSDEHRKFHLERIHPRYEKLQQKARELNYVVFNDHGTYEFGDSIHTFDESAQKIAETYANLIFLEKDKKGE